MTEKFTDYCADFVHAQDNELYTIALFTPRRRRTPLWAVFAFQCEIMRIARVVSNPILGRIRLQWWREAIARLYQGKPDAHEVIRALHYALQHGSPWQEQDFYTLIDAHEFEFQDEVGGEDINLYLKNAFTPLLYLACQAIGENAHDTVAIAKAYGLIKLRVAVPEFERTKIRNDALRLKRQGLPRLLRLFLWLVKYKTCPGDPLLPLRLLLFS